MRRLLPTTPLYAVIVIGRRYRRPRNRRDLTLNSLDEALLLAVYNTLRAEVHRSMDYAQGVVRWSIGAFGAVLAASLLATHQVSGVGAYSFTSSAVLILFGLALPGVLWAAAWTWLGELIRTERAGAYLRGFERDVARVPGISAKLGHTPLRWETFIYREGEPDPTTGKRNKSPFRKSWTPYLGTAAAFFGGTLISLTLFVAWWLQMFGKSPFHPATVTWLGAAGVFEIVGIVVSFLISSELKKLGKEIATVRP